jgi:hypothetical protein
MSSNDQEMADRLGLTIRRIQQLAADGIIWRRADTNEFEIEENAQVYRIFIDRDVDEVCRRMSVAAIAVDAGLDKLAEAKGPEERMKLAREVGPTIGRLDCVLRLSIAMDPPSARQLLMTWRDAVMGRVIGDFFALARLEIKDDPA